MIDIDKKAALVVIDVQTGFDDPKWFGVGARNNPSCEGNVIALMDAWEATGRPIVVVRHDSTKPDSPLSPNNPGNRLKPGIEGRKAALLISKSVHSAFHGKPDLDAWLKAQGIGQLVISGIMTNRCCETTTRVGADLGYDVLFAVDATHTFDTKGPDGKVVTAADLTRATLASLHEEFARIVRTAEIVASATKGANTSSVGG